MPWITGKRGAYRVQWRDGGRDSPVQSSPTFADRGDAEAALRARLAETAERKAITGKPSTGMTLDTLVKRWKASRMATKRVRGPWVAEVEKYLDAMAKGMGRHRGMVDLRLSDITADAVDRWRSKPRTDGKPAGTGTDRPLSMLRSVLRYARNVLGLRIEEAVLNLEPTKTKGRVQPPLLTRAQVEAILARGALFGDGVAALLEHLAMYGCRPVDLCKTTVGDWDGARCQMRYRDTKNGTDQRRIIHPGHGRKLDLLCIDEATGERRPDTEALFLAPNRTPWPVDWKGSATALSSWYKTNIGEKLVIRKDRSGEEVGCLHASQRGIYCLKDFGITTLDRLTGGNHRVVMAMSQHKTESAMKRYLSTNEEDQRAALALIPEPRPLAPPPSAG